jgi:succinate dehydrogenase assembly factor 2
MLRSAAATSRLPARALGAQRGQLLAALRAPARTCLAPLSTDLSKPQPTNPGLDLSVELREKIAAKDQQVRAEHYRVKGESAEEVRKRLIWRSKQRGWLEVDLLLGSWAADHCMQLSDAQVAEYEKLLALETVDIFNVVSGQMQPPPGVDGPLLAQIKQYAQSFPAGRADPSAYAKIKTKMAN